MGSAVSAEVAAQFFERTVDGAARLASGDEACDLPGCRNARMVDEATGHTHRYCSKLHSQAHLLEPCGGPERANGDDPGASHDGSALTFDGVGKAIGGLGGEPRTGVRFAVYGAVMRALNNSGAASFVEAFRNFEAERPEWQRELAETPPRVPPRSARHRHARRGGRGRLAPIPASLAS